MRRPPWLARWLPDAPLGEAVWTWFTARGLRFLVGALIATVAFGTLGFMIFGGLSLFDSLYMAVITMTTVGFGDDTQTGFGRLFSVIFTIIGVGVFSLASAFVGALLVEGRIREVLGRRKMERQIRDLRDHVILCGFGRFGQMTAKSIYDAGLPLVVLDNDPAVIATAERDGILGMVADATEEDSLRMAGLQHARALLCSLSTDADNVYVILTARDSRPDISIVALARDRRADRKLLVAGATHVVSPYTIGAEHMAREIVSPHVARVVSMTTSGLTDRSGSKRLGVRMHEFPLSKKSSLAGITLRDSPLRQEFGVIVVALIDRNGEAHFNPDPDLVMQPGDVLVSVGPEEGMERLRRATAMPNVAPDDAS